MNNNLYLAVIAISLSFTFISCNQQDSSQETDLSETSETINGIDNDSIGQKVFVLPTPMQLPTILNINKYKFSPSQLAPLKSNNYVAFSEFERALNIGIYGIDLGYCAIFERTDYSIPYFNRVSELMNHKNIRKVITDEKSQRFLKNSNQVDSVSKFILESYRDLHHIYQANQQEDQGLLVLTGAFIEGLYISTHTSNIPNIQRHLDIIAQQKIFLTNLLNLLPYYASGDAFNELIEKLKELNEVFNEFDVDFDESTGKLSHSLKLETYDKIEAKIAALRNPIVMY